MTGGGILPALVLGVLSLTLIRAAFAPNPDPREILGSMLTGARSRTVGTASAKR